MCHIDTVGKVCFNGSIQEMRRKKELQNGYNGSTRITHYLLTNLETKKIKNHPPWHDYSILFEAIFTIPVITNP